MSTTFIHHLSTLPWLAWSHDLRAGVISAKVTAYGSVSSFDVPAELFVTHAGQNEFMRLAFSHWRKLKTTHETAERIKKELLR